MATFQVVMKARWDSTSGDTSVLVDDGEKNDDIEMQDDAEDQAEDD